MQIFIQSPDLQIPTQTLTLTPNSTPHDLKSSILNLNPQLILNSFLTHNGKPLSDSVSLRNSQVTPLSTLILRLRTLGGGGDGGATGAESRDCYLNMYAGKKPDKVDPNEKRLSKWSNCALSNEPLKRPVVIDLLGNVFNKEALVEALLGKKVPKGFGHIKGLKDMVPVELAEMPGGEGGVQCPVSGLEFNGKYKFYALRGCGHVLSAKALKEVKSSACLVCHKEFVEEDKIVINGNEEELAALRKKMERDKASLREKKVKKAKGAVVEDFNHVEVGKLSGSKCADDIKALEKISGKIDVNGKSVNGVAVKAKRESYGHVDAGAKKKFKAVDVAPPNANKEVYASIFTSSRKSDFKETYSCRSLPLGRN